MELNTPDNPIIKELRAIETELIGEELEKRLNRKPTEEDYKKVKKAPDVFPGEYLLQYEGKDLGLLTVNLEPDNITIEYIPVNNVL